MVILVLYGTIYLSTYIYISREIMNNYTGKKPFHPSTRHIHSLMCFTPQETNDRTQLFSAAHRIIAENAEHITISIDGADALVDADTLTLTLEGKELQFMRQVAITRHSEIAIEGTGIVTLNEEKPIGTCIVQEVVVNRAQVLADGFAFNFSAIGHIITPKKGVTPSTRYSIEGVHEGKRINVSLPIASCQELFLRIAEKHQSNVEALKPSIREFILESMQKFFPHKNGYLNDMEIKSLATKMKGAEPVNDFDKYALIAFIQITVTNYDYYKRLYNSCRNDEHQMA